MAQLKSTVVQGNLAVTDNVSIEGDITTPGDLHVENIYTNNMLRVGDTSIGKVVELTKSGLYYEKNGDNNYGTLYFPDNKTGTILTDKDVDSSYTPQYPTIPSGTIATKGNAYFNIPSDAGNGYVTIGTWNTVNLVGSNGITVYTDVEGTTITIKGSGGGGSSITVDSSMSGDSTNPVQNKVIKSYVDTRVPAPTSSDKGKFLQVNNSGKAAWVSIASAESTSF